MTRAIDVDRVKREIRKNKEKIVISCKQKYVPLSLIYEILNKAPTLTPPNEWVSVEERLPEEKQRVIVRCEHVGTSVGWILWGNWMTDIGPGAGKVTHWRPLPAPPDKDNNVPAKTPNEPLTLEQLRASPHGKIKDSTLQSICNRANEIACRPPEGEV